MLAHYLSSSIETNSAPDKCRFFLQLAWLHVHLIRNIMSFGGRPPPGVDGMYSLKVDNLTYRTSPETLKRVFEKYGDVGDIYIPRDP